MVNEHCFRSKKFDGGVTCNVQHIVYVLECFEARE